MRIRATLLLCGMIMMGSAGCHSGPSASATDGGAAVQEAEVGRLLSDLWTPENDVEHGAIQRAAHVKDRRIGEALVAKMWQVAGLWSPSYWYMRELMEGLRVQGYAVEIREAGYVLRSPTEEVIVIPSRRQDVKPDDLGGPWKPDPTEE
jgi:hypothetical protein